MRHVQRLTDQQMALIVGWLDRDDRVTAADLARRLERPYFTIAKAVQRIKERGGWYTTLRWGTCTECGQDLAMSSNFPRTAHVHCETARVIRYSRERRKRQPGQSTKYVAKWRQEHPEEACCLRRRELEQRKQQWPALPPEKQSAMLDRLHASDERDYPITLETADSRGDPWSPDEDQYILEHWHEPARDVALALGRTLWGVRGQRVQIRRAKAKVGVILPRSNKK